MTTAPLQAVTTDARLTISPLHLRINKEWPRGGSHNIHLLDNADLGVILKRGQDERDAYRDSSTFVPHDQSLVVIAVGVDDDHDEVHYSHRNSVDTEELLLEAIESLTASYQAVRRIRQASESAGETRNAFEIGRDYERGQQPGT